jgi:hypothetical protein
MQKNSAILEMNQYSLCLGSVLCIRVLTLKLLLQEAQHVHGKVLVEKNLHLSIMEGFLWFNKIFSSKKNIVVKGLKI